MDTKRYKCSQSNDDDTNSIRERPCNLLYHSAVVGGLSVGYSMVDKKLLKMKPADLGRLDIEDSTKLVGTVALAFWKQDMLVKQGIIPANIIKTA